MIGRLAGTLVAQRPPALVIDVAGVGYELQAPMTTFYCLPPVGGRLVLATHLVARDDAQTLYGFMTEADRNLFRALIRISGVGPRLGLTILSGMTAEEFLRCVHHQDVSTLVRLPGVGKKTAERLLFEMRDRLSTGSFDVTGVATLAPRKREGAHEEAVSALIALGYRPPEAERAVSQSFQEDLGTAALIKAALGAMLS